LSTGLIGLWAKKKWGIPFVFEVRDLWPEAPIQVKGIRNRLLKQYLYGLEEKIYEAANKIVALSPGIAEHVLMKYPNKELAVIPNFSDTEFFQNQTAPRKARMLKTKPFTISYVGAVGEVNDLDRLLSLAEMAMQKGKKWRFLIMGKGNQLSELENQKKKRNLENVAFLPFGDKLEVRRVLKETDLVYISFAPFPILETSSPNKFFDALAAGKPVMVNFKGWIWDVIRENDIGIFHGYACEDKAVEAIQNMENQPEKLILAGKKARKLAEQNFSKSMAISQLLSFLGSFK
jgi:glycosyltransferase involved in cell wall biosynthesis